MKKTQIPGLIDLIRLDKPEEIEEMIHNPLLDRRFESSGPLANGLILRHLLSALSFRGKRFPTISPRGCPRRARKQDLLWASLNGKASTLKAGPDQLDSLARWIAGTTDEHELGILVQQIVGSAFKDDYKATTESWSAALILDAAPRTNNPLKCLSWWLTGKLRKAKTLLASKVNGDLAGVHATGVALHNIVKSFQQMRSIYRDLGLRSSLSAEEVSRRCLFAPVAVLRQATAAGELAGCPFGKSSLIIAALGEAQKKIDYQEAVFLSHGWSRCPAEQWVPALLEGVWQRAIRNDQACSSTGTKAATLNQFLTRIQNHGEQTYPHLPVEIHMHHSEDRDSKTVVINRSQSIRHCKTFVRDLAIQLPGSANEPVESNEDGHTNEHEPEINHANSFCRNN